MTDDCADATGGGLDPAQQRAVIRERYGSIASDSGSGTCCGDDGESEATSASCCGDAEDEAATGRRSRLGYTEADLESVAAGADVSLGCGNPTAIASLEEGETVLDLGSGGGFDCFLAAREVGDWGRVIGVDMTPEMVETARENAGSNDISNVEFRLGEIEHLPVADEAVDVIISNCVVNLSPDKPQVVREAYRVLRPGGRLAVSDVVQTAEPPADMPVDPDSVTACVSGAASVPDLEGMLRDAGFENVSVEPEAGSEEFIREWDDDRDPSEFVVAATIEAEKSEN
jgi:SAM-dependent methyltransferase